MDPSVVPTYKQAFNRKSPLVGNESANVAEQTPSLDIIWSKLLVEELCDFDIDSSAELPVFCKRLDSCDLTAPVMFLMPRLSFGILTESELLLICVAPSDVSFLSEAACNPL